MFDEVIFDIETKKLFGDISTNNPADLGVSIVSLYSRKLDKNLRKKEGRQILNESCFAGEVEGEMKSF